MARLGRGLAAKYKGALKLPVLRIAPPAPTAIVALKPSRPELPKTAAQLEKERVTALVKSVEGTVYNWVRRYAQSTDHAADLMQEARLGVLRAAQLWRKDGGSNFNSYAVNWIRAHIFRYLKTHNSLVGRDWNKPGVEVMHDSSLNAPYDAANQDGESWLDMMEDEAAEPVDEVLSTKYRDARLVDKLERIRARLGPLGWDVMQSRFMRQTVGRGKDAETLEEVGARHNVSRERVRQVELQVRRLLRRYLAEFDPIRNEELEGANDNEDVRSTGVR